MKIDLSEKDVAAIESALTERVRLLREASTEHLEWASRLGQQEAEGKNPLVTEAGARHLAALFTEQADHSEELCRRLTEALYGAEDEDDYPDYDDNGNLRAGVDH